MPDAGWYRDPQDQSVEEYWDGQAWSGVRRPSSDSAYGRPGGQPSARPAGTDGQAWGQRPGYVQQPPYGAYAQGTDTPAYTPPGYAAPAPATRRRRRTTLLLAAAAVVIVVVAAGVVTVLLRSGSSPSITYHGKEIASPNAPLAKAGKAVDALVSKNHGAKSRDTRCYYAQPRTPAKGEKATDIVDSLECGPVLFVDGDRAQEYLTVPIVADTSGTQAELTAQTSGLGSDSLSAVPKGLTLVRPDGAGAPAGNGGLSVPQPPPAAKDLTIATDLSPDVAPSSQLNVSMMSKDEGVTLVSAGYIPRYGSGAEARSAPAGQRLVAFQITTGVGAIGSGGSNPTLVVDGTSRAIPLALDNEWDVAAVPSGSDPVIQLAANGFTQTLSLPAGKAGPGNIAVLARDNTTGFIGTNFTMHSTLSNKSGYSQTDKISAEANGAALYFWPPLHPGNHPSSATTAYLSVDLSYTNPSEPGKTIGYDPGLLTLELTSGRSVHPHNIASGNHIYNVFTVPASFTSGTLVVGGSSEIGHGTRQTLKETKRIDVEIQS